LISILLPNISSLSQLAEKQGQIDQLRAEFAEQQSQVDQLRAELEKKQSQLDRKVKKVLPKKPTKPLPVPNAPLVVATNPLPSPPRLIQVVTNKSLVIPMKTTLFEADGDRVVRDLDLRLPIHERDGGHGHESSDENVAYFTCRTAPYSRLEDEKIADEPMLQRPARHHFFYRN
jgi:hypothetical protein